MQNLREVVLVGSISIDRIMNFGGRYRDLIQPDKIHVLSLSILIDKLAHSRGGIGPNIAYTLSLLGDRSSLLASIGSDGKEYLEYLTNLGIDTTRIHISSLSTSTFTVLTDLDDNQVGGFYPGAMSDSESLNLDGYPPETIVVISAYDPKTMDRLVREAKERQMTLIYDVGQQVSNIDTDSLALGVTSADLVIVNDYELSVITKRLGKTEHELKKSIPVLVTTLGSQGSAIAGTEVATPISVPAVANLSIIDPTGAGDAYRAGFLYGYRRQWDLERCAKLGSVTASYALECHGTQEHTFTIDMLKERYYSTYGEQVKI